MSTYTSSDKIISTYRKNNMNTAAVDVINDFVIGNKYEVYSTKTGLSLSKIYENTASYEKDADGEFVLDDEGDKILTNNPQNNVYALCSYVDLETETWRFYVNSDEDYFIEITSDDSTIATRSTVDNVNTKYRQLTIDSTNYYVVYSDKGYDWINPDLDEDNSSSDDEPISIISKYRDQLDTVQFEVDRAYYIYNEDQSSALDAIYAYCRNNTENEFTFYLNDNKNYAITETDSDEIIVRELFIKDNETLQESYKLITIDNVNNYVICSDKYFEIDDASADNTSNTTTE